MAGLRGAEPEMDMSRRAEVRLPLMGSSPQLLTALQAVATVSPRSVFSVLSLSAAPSIPPVTPRLAFHVPNRSTSELDLGDAMIDADDFLGPPALDPPEDADIEYQLPRPARAPTPERKAAAKRRARARALSQGSQSRGARSRLRKLVRRGSASSGSSSSSSTSTASSTRRSGISTVTQSRWRFWRNDSSGSDTSSDDDDDSFIPPDPSYTLTLPSLAIEPIRSSNPFRATEAPTLSAALDSLTAFWTERRQSEQAGGDLGEPREPQGPALPKRNTVIPTGLTERVLGDGAGWWLDIQCPTVQDMRQLRRHLPLHPLTIEDILHQDPREKAERFDSLHYTFVVFRAIDESYFRWTAADGSSPKLLPNQHDDASESQDSKGSKEAFDGNGEKRPATPASPPTVRRRGQVEIVEGVGGKEGVEGVGVGAVNLYLVIFEDGLITFHFEPLDKHTARVLSKIQQYGVNRAIDANWIAYGLMDSVVDAFFPLVDFIESESKAIDDYLSDPVALEDPRAYRRRTHSSWAARSKQRLFRHLPVIPFLHSRGPDGDAIAMEAIRPAMFKPADASAITGETDRKELLMRLANTRKLVTAMSRLLTPKRDVVRGLRKRLADLVTTNERDIHMYFGDLHDHIVTLHQSLIYFESVLSHDHPAFTGILRLGLERTKQSSDRLILRLYTVILIVLPCQILTGMFSMNVNVPHNGDRENHLEEDGSPAPLNVFGIIVAGVVLVTIAVLTSAWLMMRSLKRPGIVMR